jgi:hypothetical protein
VMSSFGGLGPAAREFLTAAYRTARRSECFILGVNNRMLQTTWNTLTAATYWDARISVACSQAVAEFQGRIIANALAKRGRPLAASRTQILILLLLTHSHKSLRRGSPPGPGDKCDTQPNGTGAGSGGMRTDKPRLLLASWA